MQYALSVLIARVTITYNVHVGPKEELNQLLNAFETGGWKPPFYCDTTSAPKEAKDTSINIPYRMVVYCMHTLLPTGKQKKRVLSKENVSHVPAKKTKTTTGVCVKCTCTYMYDYKIA